MVSTDINRQLAQPRKKIVCSNTFMMQSDHELALALQEEYDNRCTLCDTNPRNHPHMWCQECYNQYRRSVPPENATFEELLAFTTQQENKQVNFNHKIPENMRSTHIPCVPIQCSICIDEVDPNSAPHDVITLKICNHTFHAKCLQGWLSLGSNTCPNCREECC